jgi:hypothetical protein
MGYLVAVALISVLILIVLTAVFLWLAMLDLSAQFVAWVLIRIPLTRKILLKHSQKFIQHPSYEQNNTASRSGNSTGHKKQVGNSVDDFLRFRNPFKHPIYFKGLIQQLIHNPRFIDGSNDKRDTSPDTDSEDNIPTVHSDENLSKDRKRCQPNANKTAPVALIFLLTTATK